MEELLRRPDAEKADEYAREEPAPDSREEEPAPRVEVRRGRVSRIVISLVLLAAALLVGYFAYQWLAPAQHPQVPGRRVEAAPQSVGAATAAKGDLRVTVDALGTVTPFATVTVQTQISGQLLEVGFTEGQTVQKGDFLAQIDPRPYELLQAQYEGQLAHDQGVLEQAKVDLQRYKTLAQQKSIAQQQYEDQVYIVQQDEGTVQLDQALIDQQKLNVSYARIVAPISGRIGLRQVDPGNYVQTSSPAGIAVITQMQPITVVFAVPEDELPDILPQLNAGTPLEVLAYDRANVRLLATGHVTALDSQIDTTTGTVKLRAEFDNTDNVLFPNQFANAELVVKTLHDAITVPVAAIQRGAPGTFVYVINADDTVSVRPVVVGPTDGPKVAITSGLAEGERVVVDGADRLRDGARVTIPAAPSSAPSTAPASAADPAPRASGMGAKHTRGGS